MSNSPQNLGRLAEETLAHLQKELELLSRIATQATTVRKLILQRENQALTEQSQHLASLQSEAQRLANYRGHLRQAIGVALDIPPSQASLRILALRVTKDLRHPLLTARKRLLDSVRHVDRLHRANMKASSTYAKFSADLLEVLTGKPQATCYGKSGRLDAGQTHAMFQTDV